jgi:glutamine synthetase
VLPEYVGKKAMSIPQAIEAVQNIFFHTSNKLYNLNLPFRTLRPSSQESNYDVQHLKNFLTKHPDVKFIRLQYEDYTATSRLRIIPVKKALQSLTDTKVLEVGITKACLGLLQNDILAPGVTATGEYKLRAILSSLRLGPSSGYASLQGEFHETDGSVSKLCPRSLLRRTLNTAKNNNLQFLIGFEIEIVFLSRDSDTSHPTILENSHAHAWSSFRSLQSPKILTLLNEIHDALSKAGIDLQQFHPEGAAGQYEFVLPPLPPLEAVDVLIHTRSIISTLASKHDLLATLHPKPFPQQCGTAAHAHISISSPNGEDPKIFEAFYQGILGSLNEITAFTYSNPISYERVKDGFWAGGRYIAWGTQNRETPLRKIEGSHWEFKCLDGVANMYLAMSVILAAGIYGVRESLELAFKDCEKDPAGVSEKERREYGIVDTINGSLEMGLEGLGDGVLESLVGKDVIERYVSVKKAEMEFMNRMSEVERWRWIAERY